MAATRILANLYFEGEIVDKDLNLSIEYYSKLKQTSYVRRQIEHAKAILTEQLCLKNASTKLFNQYLNCTNRESFRIAIKDSSAQIKRENSDYFADIYLSSQILRGTSELAVFYNNKKFVKATYTFPSSLNTQQVIDVRELVVSKYGKPDSMTGNVNIGPVQFQWTLEDQIEVKVYRDWPDTTTYLSFTHTKNNKSMEKEMARLKAQREIEEYKSQSNAF